MKKFMVTGLLAICFLMPAFAEQQTAVQPKEFVVYTDKGTRDNHYIPSGWMGDYGDIKINDQSMDNPHSGATSIQFVYTAKNHKVKVGLVFIGRIRLITGEAKRVVLTLLA